MNRIHIVLSLLISIFDCYPIDIEGFSVESFRQRVNHYTKKTGFLVHSNND